MELRDIEIFLTLAEELHFSRTAERLHVTPARVSQSIKKLERTIGGQLFVRSSRNVGLTPLGERLHRDLKAGYQQIMDGVRGAAAEARGATSPLVIAVIGPQAHDLMPVTELFQDRNPGCEVLYRQVGFHEPFAALRSGDADIKMCFLPQYEEYHEEMLAEEADLTVGPVVVDEPFVLMMSSNHPWAARESVGIEDLADCLLSDLPTSPEWWTQTIQPTRTPAGKPIPRGPKADNWEEIMAMVAADQCMCKVSNEAARHYRRPGISFVHIADAPHARWAMFWRTNAETPLIRSFAEVAREVGIRRFELA